MSRLAPFLVLMLSAFIAACDQEPAVAPPSTARPVDAGSPAAGSPAAGPAAAERPREVRAGDAWMPMERALGERVYVPIYSHIYYRTRRSDIDLAATLSIRNTDEVAPIRVTAVRYYDSDGTLVRRYVEAPVQIAPMGSTYFLIDQEDDTGGIGANFIVEWNADRAVSPPVIEAVMISATSSQGISFVTEGRVLERLRPEG